jgi:hypothetical protein
VTEETPAKPKRPRRSRYQALYEEIVAEEEAWKAEEERERIARGDPPKPPPEPFVATLRHTEVDAWGLPWTPRRPRRGGRLGGRTTP